jgi:predicted nicotinamide N-methyase
VALMNTRLDKDGLFVPFDLVVGTDVVFSHLLVLPLLDTLHRLTHASSQILLGMQVRCAKAHAMLFEHASRYFDVEVMTSDFEETDGCAGASAVECGLYRLHSRRNKALPVADTVSDPEDGASKEGPN